MSTLKPIFTLDEWAQIVRGMKLSPRRAQVLECLCLGYSDKQISASMNIGVAGVRTQVQAMFAQFEVQDRVSMVLRTVYYFRKKIEEAEI